MDDWRRRIDAELGRVTTLEPQLPGGLREAIHYSLTGEGKRLRGLILMASFEAASRTLGRNKNPADSAALAAAVEVVHAYSLVHDDLPCMDDDSMRRGRPTTHKAFDVATATIAGVAMVPLAVRQTIRGARQLGLEAKIEARLVNVLMKASGATGMVGGQLLDLEGETRELDSAELEMVHRAKTGALITAAFTMGGLAGAAGDGVVDSLTQAGASLGLAFQIADDVLDATQSSEALGKTAGKDAAASKSTYVSTLGIQAARQRAESLVQDAMSRLDGAGLRTPTLESLVRFVSARRS